MTAQNDDAEENTSGVMYRGSSDLELVLDRDNQIVGMRFSSLNIPQGATILNAYLQFKVDEASADSTTLFLQGETVEDALSFASTRNDISSRPRTTAMVSWSPPAWTSVGEAGPDQRTPDLSPIIQEIVNRAGWTNGNSLVIIVTGTGKRVAESFDGDSAGAPLLHVEYVLNH